MPVYNEEQRRPVLRETLSPWCRDETERSFRPGCSRVPHPVDAGRSNAWWQTPVFYYEACKELSEQGRCQLRVSVYLFVRLTYLKS